MVRSRRRCALHGRCSCSSVDAAGRIACRRSQRCTHAANPPARQRRMRRDCAYHSPQWSSRRGSSSDELPADWSWCTVGSLAGFAFGLVSDLSELMRGSEGAPARPGMNGPCHRRASAGLVLRGYVSVLPVGPCLAGLCIRAGPVPVGQAEQSRGREGWRPDEASAPLLPIPCLMLCIARTSVARRRTCDRSAASTGRAHAVGWAEPRRGSPSGLRCARVPA
jgi:hypothetical protein